MIKDTSSGLSGFGYDGHLDAHKWWSELKKVNLLWIVQNTILHDAVKLFVNSSKNTSSNLPLGESGKAYSKSTFNSPWCPGNSPDDNMVNPWLFNSQLLLIGVFSYRQIESPNQILHMRKSLWFLALLYLIIGEFTPT